MIQVLRPALVLFVLLSALTGLLYPAAVTAIGKLAFPAQSTGSLIVSDGKVTGSSLIGQPFSRPGYFWGRLSATAPAAYNALASGGSNLASTNPALMTSVKTRIAALKAADPSNTAPIPVDLVTASASGLDPHISAAAAYYQVARVVRARGIAEHRVLKLVDAHIEPGRFGFLGEARVNVLELNLALNELR